jgi:hypothetical protein
LQALEQLTTCFKGAPSPDCDWARVIALANRGLITAQLAAALEPVSQTLPRAVWGFLDEVRRRAQERDHRMRVQLGAALSALNGVGLEPILLKGAALWATFPNEASDRIMSDLDLLIEPADIQLAVDALQQAGFMLMRRRHGRSFHVLAELGRAQDPGMIDLHQRPPGPPGITGALDLAPRCARHLIAGGAALAPDPAAQLLLIVLHDQLHDGDYWRGGFDLRHALDIARLAPGLTQADRDWLHQACLTDFVRKAAQAQLLAARSLFGGSYPVENPDRAAKVVARWRLQAQLPALRGVLAAGALVADWRALARHRRTVIDDWAQGAVEPEESAASPFQRLGRLADILRPRAGKI